MNFEGRSALTGPLLAPSGHSLIALANLVGALLILLPLITAWIPVDVKSVRCHARPRDVFGVAQ